MVASRLAWFSGGISCGATSDHLNWYRIPPQVITGICKPVFPYRRYFMRRIIPTNPPGRKARSSLTIRNHTGRASLIFHPRELGFPAEPHVVLLQCKFGLCAAGGPLYGLPVDTIVIRDLGVLCHIGVPPEERANAQRLMITVEMRGDFSRACATDEIQHTINYYDVSRRIVTLCQEQSYRLIEKLAEDIARIVLEDFGALETTIEVKKSILSDARYVSVRINRKR